MLTASHANTVASKSSDLETRSPAPAAAAGNRRLSVRNTPTRALPLCGDDAGRVAVWDLETTGQEIERRGSRDIVQSGSFRPTECYRRKLAQFGSGSADQDPVVCRTLDQPSALEMPGRDEQRFPVWKNTADRCTAKGMGCGDDHRETAAARRAAARLPCAATSGYRRAGWGFPQRRLRSGGGREGF